jgi:uncharacterized protein YbjQ (UPF0145 family)
MHAKAPVAEIALHVSTLSDRPQGTVEIGVVYASVEGVNEHSFDACLHELKEKAQKMGATALVGLQLVQSQFQWNQRTSLLATAFKPASAGETAHH